MRASLPRFRTKPPEPVQPGICLNCGARVESKYCSECSQENEPLRLGIGHIFVDALEEFIKFDSKLFNTLRPLFLKPGFLTQEWARGRRVGYISPFKLYLTSTFLFFLIAAWTVDHDPALNVKTNVKVASPSKDSLQDRQHPPEIPEGPIEEYVDRATKKLDKADAKDIPKVIVEKLPTALFILLPVFAIGLKIFYVRSGRYYVEHLVFSLHNHAFYFMVLSLTSLLPGSMDSVGFLICAVYSLLAMKRYYAQSWPKTLVKSSMLGCGYLVLLGFTLFGAIVAGLMAMPDKPEPTEPAGTKPSAQPQANPKLDAKRK